MFGGKDVFGETCCKLDPIISLMQDGDNMKRSGKWGTFVAAAEEAGAA